MAWNWDYWELIQLIAVSLAYFSAWFLYSIVVSLTSELETFIKPYML
jgi:hypothetical protein